MNFVAVTQSLALLALMSAGVGVLLLLALAIPGTRDRLRQGVGGAELLLMGVAFGVALISTLGSLYYSEVSGFVPCSLCWYQRIFMYPLVPLAGLALIRRETRIAPYGALLAAAGLAIALYHITIQFRPALDVGVCGMGVPCTARYLAVFGFVSIPVMASGGFFLLLALFLLVWLGSRRAEAGVSAPSEGSGY
jgi:disulfide bond formation protein DsbB